jgi:hypothetical protein
VYGLSHVGLYLGWDLSDFIYLFIIFFSKFVCGLSSMCGLLLSQFFYFFIVLVLLNWGLMKLKPFKLLNFLWLEALNFDDNFFWALLKKIWALNF